MATKTFAIEINGVS
jgi:chromosome segregation ATPase